jgi:hypothetical protein
VLFPLSHANAQSEGRKKDDLRPPSAGSRAAHTSPSTFLSGGQLAATGTASASEWKGTIQSPSSLLTALRDDSIRKRERGLDINMQKATKCDNNNSNRIPTACSSSSSSSSSSGICSGSRAASSSSSSGGSDGGHKSIAPLMKKGFLGHVSKPLYPEGSGEGPGTGGSFARVMEKCRVINMADHDGIPALATVPSGSTSVDLNGSNRTVGDASHTDMSDLLKMSKVRWINVDYAALASSTASSSPRSPVL